MAAIFPKITLTLLTLAAVTWVPVGADEATEAQHNATLQRLTSIKRTADYVAGVIRHASKNIERHKQSTDYPRHEVIKEKLQTLRQDLDKVYEKVEAAKNSEGNKMVANVKSLKATTRQFHKTLKDLTSDMKVAAKSLKGQMRTQANRHIKTLERGGTGLMERVKRLSPPVSKETTLGGEDSRDALRNESTTSANITATENDFRFRSLLRGPDDDVRLAKQEVLVMSDSGRSLMDVSRMETYLDLCPTCMVRTQKYQCPLHGPALDMTKWAKELQDLVSFGCAIPDGCDGNTKCCLSADPEVRKAISSVTKTLRDLYMTFQKSCTKCNKILQDEAKPDEWTSWGSWESCDVTCGTNGRRRRERQCVRPTTRQRATRCSGAAVETGRCPAMAACETIQWGSWGSWSSCDVTCGRDGTRSRERECFSLPSRRRRPNQCSGRAKETARCPGLPTCETIQWGSWGSWSNCDVTCGRDGTRTRERECLSLPSRRRRPNQCSGRGVETVMCTGLPACETIQWGSWGSWSNCDVTCGRDGTRTRERECLSFPSRERRNRCSGSATMRGRCPLAPCPIRRPEWASWGSWSSCSVTCDRGVQYRRRSCPRSRDVTTGCVGEGEERRSCDTRVPCCVDGNWSSWSSWGACSATCGSGKSLKSRTCSNPAPNECGRSCPGSAVASRTCGLDKECCVDGNWGQWLGWSACSVTCGDGVQTNRRRCDSPARNYCGRRCDGNAVTSKRCNDGECCVDGNWSNWGRWSECSATCGSGRRQRERQCSNPRPSPCGRSCPGSPIEAESCQAAKPCEVCVDGNWGSWQRWSSCSVSCGTGRRTRRRVCDNPARQACGKECAGSGEQAETCTNRGRDGNWGTWGAWSTCSASCGEGEMTRRRVCDSPAPDGCGFPCMGQDRDKKMCNERPCCVDGNWGFWQSWSSCSVTCGRGERQRERLCDSPAANYCGRRCSGRANDVEPCDSGKPCCVDGNWGYWTAWSSCSATCGESLRERTRECDSPAANECGRPCPGDSAQTKTEMCGLTRVDGEWGQWTSWTSCSETCGVGARTRRRDCNNPPANPCGRECAGIALERETCVGSEGSCDCELRGWAAWAAWGKCSKTCGYGVRERTRECAIMVEGRDCGFGLGNCQSGSAREVGTCLESPVCVDVSWGQWGNWGPCLCRTATRTRRRECFRSLPGSEAMVVTPNLCTGDEKQDEACAPSQRCPDCIITCDGKPDGQYPSCFGCGNTVVCSGGRPKEFKDCDKGSEWDAFSEKCVYPPSPSCMIHGCCRSCTGKPDGFYPDCDSCTSYIQCLDGNMLRVACTKPGQEWNQITQRCEPAPSPTCRREFTQSGNFVIHDRIATLFVDRTSDRNKPNVTRINDRLAVIEGNRIKTDDDTGTGNTPGGGGAVGTSGTVSVPRGMVDRNGVIIDTGDRNLGNRGPTEVRVYGGSGGAGASGTRTYVTGTGNSGTETYLGGTGTGSSNTRIYVSGTGNPGSRTYVSGTGTSGTRTYVSGTGNSGSRTYVSGTGTSGTRTYVSGTGNSGSRTYVSGTSVRTSGTRSYVSGTGTRTYVDGTGTSDTGTYVSGIGTSDTRSGTSIGVSSSGGRLSGGVVPVNVFTVPDCVEDCQGAIPGKYPSCAGCEYYVICTRNGRLRQRKCQLNRKWDNKLQKCTRNSSTCP